MFAAVVTLTVVALSREENIYQAEGKIRFTRADRTTALTGVGALEGDFTSVVDSNNPMTTEMEVIRSVPIIQKTLERLKADAIIDSDTTRKNLLDNLQLTSLRGTDILLIAYQDPNPEVAESVVDTIMQIYVENHVQENRFEAIAAREFIERELPGAEARVRDAEAALRSFQETNGIAALEVEKGEMVASTEDLRRRVAEAESALADAQAQSTALSQQLGMTAQEALMVTTLSQSPGVQEVLTQYQAVEAELAIERVRYQDASPVIQALLDRRNNLEELLTERVATTLDGQSINRSNALQIGELQADLAGDLARTEVRRLGLMQQVNTLRRAQAFYDRRLATLPRLEQEHRELLRRLDAAQSTYSLLLNQLYETRVTENQNVGNARILQSAFVLESPVEPRKLSFIATGVMLAGLLSIATAFMLETQDKVIKTAKEAKAVFNLTLLGVIPLHRSHVKSRSLFRHHDEGLTEVIVRDHPESPIAESYRMLQANLRFSSSDRAIKTVVVTSAIVGEGKSVVSANLAMAKAQLGHRVLLVDADMRCPRQHQIWDVINDRGLSNVIVEHCALESVVKPLADNLDLLTAGVIPPNPTALLDSQRMEHLIEQFSQSYDFVVIDTPALNIAVDVHILGRLSHGILMVSRPGILDMGNALIARESLAQLGGLVLGQVINGVTPENEPYSYPYFTRTYAEQNSLPTAQTEAALIHRG